MIDPQTAADMSGGGLYLNGAAVAGLIGLVITNIGFIGKEFVKGRLARRNSGGLNADDKRTLKEHDRAITRHESEIKALCQANEQARKENREDHQRLFDKLEEMRTGK